MELGKRTIGICTGISHGEEVLLVVLLDEVFIRELFTVDGLPASPLRSKAVQYSIKGGIKEGGRVLHFL